MGRTLLVILLGVVATLPCLVTSYTHDNVKDLLTHLFTTNTYNKMVRPAADQSESIILYVNLNLIGITDIDEVQEKMSTTAFLELFWTDAYLTWNPADHNNTDILYVQQSAIWKPDIALKNGFTKLKELGDTFLLAKISFDGHIEWRPFEVFETKCSIGIENFPFDKQTCDIKFGVWMTPLSHVDIELGSKGILLDEYQPNGEWDVIDTSSKAEESLLDGAVVTFSITVKRKPQYILYNVVLPIVMLSLLSIFVFALPVDSGEKMGYIMTVYLAFAVFLTIVSGSLPSSASMSLLSMYLILLLCMGTAIVMITILELRIHYRDSSWAIPKIARGIIRFSKTLRCVRSTRKVQDIHQPEEHLSKEKNKTENGKPVEKPTVIEAFEKPESAEDFTWPDVTSAIDFCCFWLFMLATISITVIIFVNGYISSND